MSLDKRLQEDPSPGPSVTIKAVHRLDHSSELWDYISDNAAYHGNSSLVALNYTGCGSVDAPFVINGIAAKAMGHEVSEQLSLHFSRDRVIDSRPMERYGGQPVIDTGTILEGYLRSQGYSHISVKRSS